MPKKSSLPRNVTEYQDRHKKWRLRFRAKGKPIYYFKHAHGTPEFREELDACRVGKPLPAIRTSERTKPGSMSALIAMYYGSPEFTGLAQSTQRTYRGILERFRVEWGDLSVATLQRQSIKDILGVMADRPSAANNLLDRLKSLMRFAMDAGWRTDDPTFRVRGFKITSEGYHTWTEEELAAYEARHPLETKAHLAYALMLYTGQRRSDAVVMGFQHVAGDRISVRQIKTRARLSIPMHHALQAAIDGLPKDRLTFLVTEYGKPFTAPGFGNWFRKRCDEAGLDPICSAHGLRKAAARRMAEAGCSNQQIKAITGHKTDKEVSRYTAAASQLMLADQAITAVGGTKREQKNG